MTDYVRKEFKRAEDLQSQGRDDTVGFALTILQRRLASSPEAIYQSLRRRRERLENRRRELELRQRGGAPVEPWADLPRLEADDLEDLEEAPGDEQEAGAEQLLDQATAARTLAELKAEIDRLKELEGLALQVRRSGVDKKWEELSNLLQAEAEMFDRLQHRRKLVIFTEHRDTLNYLQERIARLLGKPEAVLILHGGMSREDRAKVQGAFRHDPQVEILVATDAAGEGINLQRAHLMVNYDLPWNPNRIEQRFGRIHRIGQSEVCHLWNLVAEETREGEVYRTLLDKLDAARQALGGKVFDVLGKVVFDGKPLRELLVEAVLYGEQPATRARLQQVVGDAFDHSHLQALLEERALARDVMDLTRVRAIREEMERAEARRLQPHYIQSFFLEALRRLGGAIRERETRRYEVTHVPAVIRQRDRLIGLGEPVLERYERITFEKSLINVSGQPLAAFVCPGHPLLAATLDLTLERHRDLLKRGAVLVDERDPGVRPRVLFYLEHTIQDAVPTRTGEQRTISQRLLYVERDETGICRQVRYAPYLDHRPLREGEPGVERLLALPECAWITHELEVEVQGYAVAQVVPDHLGEIRGHRQDLLDKTEAAVKDRLTKEINYWDHRAEALKLQEQAGKPNARLNSQEARKRADALEVRLRQRLEEVRLERQIAPLPPVVLGGVLVVPIGLVHRLTGIAGDSESADAADRLALAARAREVVMTVERRLGFEPIDREAEKLGYDIESRIPDTGRLRFIEVKGRVAGAATLTVTRNEILYSLNQPDNFILAIVVFDGAQVTPYYLRQPFRREPDFGVTSVNYSVAELLARSTCPA